MKNEANNNIELSRKYAPLFEILQGKHEQVDTVIITGGRYSLKSYTVSIFAVTALRYYGWSTLYTRYTNTSIVDSIKPEVSDKLELLGIDGQVRDTKKQLEHKDNRIAFKGIKPGSGQQTANLKSLSGFNCFINDEAEELPTFEAFKKVYYSIRQPDKRNLSILILNPTTREHWIFKEFFEKKGLQGGDNCIVDNVLYIHATYLDCTLSLMPQNILADYERLKIDDPTYYNNVILGGWITEPAGVLLPKSKLNYFKSVDVIPKESILWRMAISDPADKGGDKYSNPFITVCSIDNRIACFVTDAIHSGDGVEACAERIPLKIKELGIEAFFIESNGVGLAPALLIKKMLPESVKYAPFHSTINKETRILSHYEFVRDYFYFLEEEYQHDEYKLFMYDATNYKKEDANNENKHKRDAMDVLAAAAHIIKLKYHKIIYGN